MSARYDFALRQGNDFARIFRFRDAGGALVNLTGSVVELSVAVGVGRIERWRLAITSPSSGEATLRLTPEDTRKLPVGPCPFEMERRFDQPGSETTIMTGVIVVERGMSYDR